MFVPEPMREVNLFVQADDLEAVTEALARKGALHIDDVQPEAWTTSSQWAEVAARYHALNQRLGQLLTGLGVTNHRTRVQRRTVAAPTRRRRDRGPACHAGRPDLGLAQPNRGSGARGRPAGDRLPASRGPVAPRDPGRDPARAETPAPHRRDHAQRQSAAGERGAVPDLPYPGAYRPAKGAHTGRCRLLAVRRRSAGPGPEQRLLPGDRVAARGPRGTPTSAVFVAAKARVRATEPARAGGRAHTPGR